MPKQMSFSHWRGIVRMNTDGTGREVCATGIRKSVGMNFRTCR